MTPFKNATGKTLLTYHLSHIDKFDFTRKSLNLCSKKQSFM